MKITSCDCFEKKLKELQKSEMRIYTPELKIDKTKLGYFARIMLFDYDKAEAEFIDLAYGAEYCQFCGKKIEVKKYE